MTFRRHLRPDGPSKPVRRCRVCLKPIRENEFHLEVYLHGQRHVVCCASCATKFEANPEVYLVP